MALDYDKYENYLWVGADDGYGNISARIKLNGTASPEVTLVNPPAGMDVTRNNEGLAIAEPEYKVDGLRPVYHFMDGENNGVLTISYLNCDYKSNNDNSDNPGDDQQNTVDENAVENGQQNAGANTNTNDKTASVNKQTSGSPKTGDNANTVFWVLLEIMAAFVVIVNVKNKKRKEL